MGYAAQSVDFVDHYRGQNQPFDYVWEERWVRDEGFLKIVPNAVRQALANAGAAASELIISAFLRPLDGLPACWQKHSVFPTGGA
ncbi:MAG: hypothetical protein CM1200mP41_26780 [Gammaproteobacteria bacterium]|nr:MAG: hypothetical protein CM1200mP41_26780 [Gammaproteobacteria bacterium]